MSPRYGYRRRRVRRKRLGGLLCLAALMGGVAWWWWGFEPSGRRSREGHDAVDHEGPLGPLLQSILTALDSAGSPLPEVAGALQAVPWGPMRAELGLEEATACTGVFFAGVRAQVQGEEEWSAPVEVVWGKLYFHVGEAAGVLELTARRSGNGYVLTRVWNWKRIAALPEDPAAVAHAALEDIETPADRPGPPGQLLDAQSCTVMLVP